MIITANIIPSILIRLRTDYPNALINYCKSFIDLDDYNSNASSTATTTDVNEINLNA